MATIPMGLELATQLASSTVKFNPGSHLDENLQLLMLGRAGDVQTPFIPLEKVPMFAKEHQDGIWHWISIIIRTRKHNTTISISIVGSLVYAALRI